MDIEQKLKDIVSTFSRKKHFKYDADDTSEPNIKKTKMDFSPESIAPLSRNVETNRNYITSLSSNDTPLMNTDDVDTRNFFSQFLVDQSATLHKPITHEYYSPIEFPWFYPSYYYPGYFVMPPPPIHVPTTTTLSSDIKSEFTANSRIKAEENCLPSKNIQPDIPLKDTPCISNMTKKTSSKSTVIKSTKKFKNQSGRKSVAKNSKNVVSPVVQRLDGKSLKRSLRLKESMNRKTRASSPSTTPATAAIDPSAPPKLVAKGSVKRLAPNTINNTSKKFKPNNNSVKFRYSVRQRLKALKKANKLSSTEQEQQQKPKYVLKKLDKKTSTKKELFLACLGLRRILKHIS